MLKEQLEELRRTKRTLLHAKDTLVRFIRDEDVDTLTLFNNLPFSTPFTSQKSLSFDRHTLSEKEEKKFNSKFAPFLKNLISEFKSPDIDILLEYLVRVYCIDTFNPQELTFLLLPFKKYFDQLQTIARNTKNPFSNLRSYSISSISRILVRDRRLMLAFVEYFNAYEMLKEFLDRAMDEIIELLKTSSVDYLSEIYKIMVLLIQQNNPLKALQIYHRMRTYLSTDDFQLLLLPHFSKDLVEMKEHKEGSNKYQAIFNSKSGRGLLKNQIELYRYLEYLQNCSLTPEEFDGAEYKVLQHIFFGKEFDQVVDDIHSSGAGGSLVELFKEIEPKKELLGFIVRNNIQKYFAEYFSDEDKIHLIKESFDISWLTPSNYHLCIMNLSKHVFKSQYAQILEKCLHFQTFDPLYFDTLIDFNVMDIFAHHSLHTSIYRQNVIRLFDSKGVGLSDVFLDNNFLDDVAVLSYLLVSGHPFSENQLSAVIKSTKALKSPLAAAELLYYILKNFEKLPLQLNFNDTVSWMINDGFLDILITSTKVFSEKHFNSIDTDLLYRIFLESARSDSGDVPVIILKTLKQREFDVVDRLYVSKDYETILKIASLTGLSEILVSHPNTLDFIEKCHSKISDQRLLVEFIINNSQSQKYLFLLVHFIDILITFRTHHSWNMVKAVLIECLSKKHQCQHALEYILSHFDLFDSSDEDLFQKIFSSGAVFDVKHVENILCCEPTAATFVHSYLLLNGDAEVLPVLPCIVPLLIKHKKDTVVPLFRRYGNVMAVYAKTVLQHYPEIGHVLLELDPRFAVKELCISATAPNINILLKILRTKTCGSSVVFKRLCAFFKKHAGSLIISEHILALIKFFKNSVNTNDSTFSEVECALSDLLANVYASSPAVFYELMFEGVSMSSSIFADSANLVLQNLYGGAFDSSRGVAENMKFLCHFLEYESITPENTMALYGRIFASMDDLSPKLISCLIKNDIQVLEECVDHLLLQLNDSLDMVYILDILFHISSSVSECKKFKNKILPHVLVLSEDENRAVSEKASQVVEALQ